MLPWPPIDRRPGLCCGKDPDAEREKERERERERERKREKKKRLRKGVIDTMLTNSVIKLF